MPWLPGADSAEPYQIRQTNPVSQDFRMTAYPELIGRGVRCMGQDVSGKMWFGVRDGVVSYDGSNWKNYGIETGLSENPVNAITVREDGTLLAGTTEGLYQAKDERWQRMYPDETELPLHVNSVRETADQSLWVCCKWGLVRLRKGQSTLFTSADFRDFAERFGPFDVVTTLPNQCIPGTRHYRGTGIVLIGQTVAMISEDSPARDAGLKVGDTLLQVDGESTDLTRRLRRGGIRDIELVVRRSGTGVTETIRFMKSKIELGYRWPAMHSIMQDRQGRIWVGVSGGRLIVSDDGGETWQVGGKKSEGLVIGSLPTAVEESNGKICIVSSERDSHLSKWDGSRWTSRFLSTASSADFVANAVQTDDDTLWVSGLYSLHVHRRNGWKTYDTRDLKIGGASHRLFVASDRALWILGVGHSAVRIAISPNEFMSVKNLRFKCVQPLGTRWYVEMGSKRIVREDRDETWSYGIEDDVISDPATIVSVPGQGVVAVGSHNGVAAVSTFREEKWTRVEFPEVANDLSGNSAHVASDGLVWVASRGDRSGDQVGGVVVGFGDQWKHIRPPEAPIHATTIAELPDGRMMVAAGFGIRFHDATGWSHPTDDLLDGTKVSAAAVDERGTVWLATRSRGIMRFRDNQWVAFTKLDGLPSNEVSTIIVGADQSVVASTAEGLCQMRGDRFHRVALPSHLGRRALAAEPGGAIWLDGSLRVMPDTNGPTAALNADVVKVNSDSEAVVSWHGVDAWNRTAADHLDWSYRIDGGPWSSYVNKTQLILSGLKPGSHSIQVRSRDEDFNESPISPAASILVRAPYWMQPWFLGVVALTLAILIWQSASLIRRGIALRRTNKHLEQARLQLAEKFAEKSAQFRAICDCSPVGIFVADTSGQVTYMNRHLERIGGFSKGPGNNAESWFHSLHPDDREDLIRSWNESRENRTPFQGSGRIVRDDGTITWFDVAADRIESQNGFIGYVGAVEDVSDRVVASEELKTSNTKLRGVLKQLEYAQAHKIKRERLSALGQMAAGVAHDINNTLSPLLTYAELLASEQSIQGETRQWVELIRLGVSDTAGIVKRLEHFYRQSHNQTGLESIDLRRVAMQAIDMTRPKWQDEAYSQGKSIEVVFRSESDTWIMGHPAQIRSVLTNLIFNAVDAIPHNGTVTVRLDAIDDQAILEVADDGPGMTSEQLDRCLEPFFTSKPKGSGLGLSECHGVVRQHRGKIEIESAPGQGTTVRIRLPADGDHGKQSQDASATNEAATYVDEVFVPNDNAPASRVLYIDDDDAVRRSTTVLLTSMGIAVEAVADGPTGLLRLEKSDFHLVICDQGLPGMDGIEVLAAIKKGRPNMPVVIVSGWSLQDTGDTPHPDGFLEKPVAYEDLVSLLKRHLSTFTAA